MVLSVVVRVADAETHEEALETAQKLIEQVKHLTEEGQYQEALPLAQHAIAIRENELGPEHPDTADALFQLARLDYISGSYADAERLDRRALAIRERILGAEHPDTANSLNLLGDVLYVTGAYVSAEPIYSRALAIREKVLGPDHSDTAISLTSLANLYSDIGAYAKAESLYRRAVTIREKVSGPEHPDTATLLSNLGALYHDTGANTEAESLFLRALAIREKALGPEHSDTADSLNNLAVIYFDREDFTKSETLLQRALSIYQKVLGPDHPYTAMSLNNLAELYFATQAYRKAEEYQKKALAIQENALGSEHPDVAQSLKNLAALYAATGANAKAAEFYQHALVISEKALGAQHPAVAEFINALAVWDWKVGKTSQALPLFERAQTIQAKNLERFLLSVSESRQRAYLQTQKTDLNSYVSFSVAVPNRRSIALGLTGVLHYKGRVLDASSNNVARLRGQLNDADRSLFERLADVASQSSTLTYQGTGNLSPLEYRERMDRLKQEQDSLEAALAKRSSEFGRQLTPITIESVRRSIPPKSVLIEWLQYRPLDLRSTTATDRKKTFHYAAYMLTSDGELGVVDVGEAQQIDELARDFRIALSDSSRADVKSRAQLLTDRLLKPLRSYIAGSEHLLISPDGALNLIPFAALLDEQGNYLAEHTEVTYLTSGRDLLHFAADRHSNGSVVVANPDYGKPLQLLAQNTSLQPQRSADLDRSGLIFRPLANTMVEANALKSLLKLDNDSVLIGADATEARIKQLHGPQILHIASHGFFLSDQEFSRMRGSQTVLQGEHPLLRSGIALAGANERRSGASDDGILTALEAAQLDLHGTQLVALSVCDSGVGEIQNGEGVYGLRRALVLAGAQTELMSLWKVSDESTAKLMRNFYERLMRGESRSAALYHAQKSFLADGSASHPYYWAAFVLIGNGAPLPTLH